MLAPGLQLGRYEVRERLGAGGMGEVFRAHDSRLGRDVALKVLKESFKLDPHRLARFERETQVLASLNHSNIATLYGIEALGDTHALVLELVEGETLAERIALGPIPVAEAFEIAEQIAAALDAAHEHGVVHRDLKPGNVKLRPDGTVKLLDFGLAKIPDPVGEKSNLQAVTATAIDLAAGGAGVMGTPAYMSPEQARGLPVDKRSDIWAFGCVLFEMLTGERAFERGHTSDVVAKVIECEPDLGALPSGVPPAIQRLLRRCLEKDPRRRLRDMGDARLDLLDAIGNPADEAPDRRASSASIAPGAVIAAAVSAMLAGTAVWLAVPFNPSEPAPPRIARFSIPDHGPPPLLGVGLAISSDGMHIAYVTDRGLTVRSRDRLENAVVVDRGAVEGSPFFAPDGSWLGFTGWDTLKKVPTAGGPAVTVTESNGMGEWTGERIMFADAYGVFRISANGGEPEQIFTYPNLLEQAVFPQFLPAREAVLFTVIPTRRFVTVGASNSPGARVDVLDLTTGGHRTILHGGGRARYVPTGHLIYAAGGTLYAVAFDLDRLEVRGDAVPVVVSDAGFIDFAVSDEGTLVYQAGEIDRLGELVWVDRQGREESLGAPIKAYVYPRLSPDGTRVALDVADSSERKIWMWDLRRRALERFTRDPAANRIVEWSPDGRYVVFGSNQFGVTNLFRQASDGSGEPERLLASDRLQMPIRVASGEQLLFSTNVPGQQRDIQVLSLDGSRRAEPLIHGPANELNADVSPDGRWLAYDSDESGQFEVYVRSYSDPYGGGRWQISSEGGRQPLWSSDGTELFYRDFSGAMMAASVTPGPSFTPGPVVRLFENTRYVGGGAQGGGRTYDAARDGRRFLMIKDVRSAEGQPLPSLVVVLNWFEQLERLVPVR